MKQSLTQVQLFLLFFISAFTTGWSQPLYVEQFDLESNPINFSGSNAANISASRIGSYGACGEVKISQVNAFSNGFQTFNYDFSSPVTITNASDAKIKIRLRTASPIPLRIAFRGDNGTGVKNLSCVWASKETNFTGDINTWQELVYDYSAAGDLNVSGCSGSALGFPATLNGIAININSGSTTFNDPVYIDYISIGNSSPMTMASCKTDISSGTPAASLFVQQFDPSETNPKEFKGTEVTSGNISSERMSASTGANCGQIDVQNAAGNLTLNYTTINLDTVITIQNASDAVIRVRAKVTNGTAVPVRAVFRGKPGGASTVNLTNVWAREEKALSGNGSWQELVFYYGFAGDLNSSGGAGTALMFPATIDGIGIAFYTGSSAVSAPVSIDYIAIGNTPSGCVLSDIKKETLASDLQIYPVPAEDVLTISSKRLISEAKIEILNGLGIVVMEGQMINGSASLNTSLLPTGIYFVGILVEDELISYEKILVK